MNMSEKAAAQDLRDMGFKSAFAFDDGVALSSEDANKLLSAARLANLLKGTVPKGHPRPIKEAIEDAAHFNF